MAADKKDRPATTTAPEANSTPEQVKAMPLLAGVQHQIDSHMASGRLTFPSDFNQANAMASAKIALVTLGVIDANGNPTGKCTTPSLVNALFDSMVQGMNVAKKQGYFINYGNVLTFQRSYFGDQALAERVRPGINVYCDVIYKGEKFKPAKVRSKFGLITVVEIHEMAWPRESKEIVGAYCGCYYLNGSTGEMEDMGIELMDIEQIRTSWKKSKAMGPTSFHNEQPDQACKRTVIRRWSKPIVNASTDELLQAALKRQDMESTIAEFAEVVDEQANKTTLALEPSAAAGTGEQIGQAPAAAEPEPVATAATAQAQEPQQKLVDENDPSTWAS